MANTEIIFLVSIPNKDSSGFLYTKEQPIYEADPMSEGERIAWLHNGQATTDMDHYDKQGNTYEVGKKYFNGVFVWKGTYPQTQWKSKLTLPQRQTSDTWVVSEWEQII